MRAKATTLLVLAFASAIRFPHFDVAWFGIDQVYFLAEARRILAGARDVVGPLSSGLNLLGPLYSYFLAGLLWIRNDAAFLGLIGAACEVIGAWLIFDTARRLAGTLPGLAAAVCYAVSPILVLSTRLIWNPSLLPMMVALGWWMAVRYAQGPTTPKLIGTALVAGLMLPLHPTGVFPAIGVVLAVLLSRRPSLPQLAAAAVAGALPLLPTLVRMSRRSDDVGSLGALLTVPADVVSIVPGIVALFLSFPARLVADDVMAGLATTALYGQALIGVAGALWGITAHGPFRPIWIALALSCLMYLSGAAMYAGAITWYYLLAFVPPGCLFVASAVRGLPRRSSDSGRGRAKAGPRRQRTAATAVFVLAAAQVVFLYQFDRTAISTGLLHVDSSRLMLRRPPGEAFALTLREVRAISNEAGELIPDGATALMAAHGLRGELWRESGAEFMPWAAAPQADRPWQFMVVGGREASICPFRTPSNLTWRVQHRALPGWETAPFDDREWVPVDLPRRTPGPSLSADPRFSTWRSPRVVLRGRLTVDDATARRLLAITVHNPTDTTQVLSELYVNGVALSPARHRVMYAIYRNEEWLIDLTGRVQEGENLIAIGFAGTATVFDLDVFEVPPPCSTGD